MEKNIRTSLEQILAKYQDIERHLGDENVIQDIERYSKYSKKQKTIAPVVLTFQKYLALERNLLESKEILQTEKDKEMIKFANDEIDQIKPQLAQLEAELKIHLLPKDEADDKNVIVEIRGAAGGEEANLFAADLYKMYFHYAENANWKIKLNESQTSESGGFSFISFSVRGENVYAKMKFETGSHRVQRIPETEANGRVHTSTAVVTIIPEIDDSIEIKINPVDLRIDTYRASGAGGQHVNTTDSAIRITHLPTNIVVTSQDGRSQHANREQAMRILKSKLYEREVEEKNKLEGAVRKLAGSGFRSEKIRTYNFPQNRVTDHRINFTKNNLDRFLAGDMEDMFEALVAADQAEKIKEAGFDNN